MPIRAENKGRYPKEWPTISLWVRVCAGWRCEWCDAIQGAPHPLTKSRVVLTVAHMNHTPEDCRPDNLRALCQRCHLRYDAVHHRTTRSRTPDLLCRAVEMEGETA